MALHGCYRREYAALWQRISEDLGGSHELIDSDAETFPDRWPEPGPDLVAFRWIADYPDAGSFLQVLHFFSEVGMLAEQHAKEIAQRIAAARLERELPARRAHYLEVEALLEQECLVLPLFHEQAYRFAAPDLTGLRLGLGVPEVRYEELRRGRRRDPHPPPPSPRRRARGRTKKPGQPAVARADAGNRRLPSGTPPGSGSTRMDGPRRRGPPATLWDPSGVRSRAGLRQPPHDLHPEGAQRGAGGCAVFGATTGWEEPKINPPFPSSGEGGRG